jgi:hypothetical protein
MAVVVNPLDEVVIYGTFLYKCLAGSVVVPKLEVRIVADLTPDGLGNVVVGPPDVLHFE